MSQSRKDIIMKAFKKMDTTGDGEITVEDLMGYVWYIWATTTSFLTSSPPPPIHVVVMMLRNIPSSTVESGQRSKFLKSF